MLLQLLTFSVTFPPVCCVIALGRLLKDHRSPAIARYFYVMSWSLLLPSTASQDTTSEPHKAFIKEDVRGNGSTLNATPLSQNFFDLGVVSECLL